MFSSKIEVNSKKARMWSKMGMRGTFGAIMMELGALDDELMVLSADLANTSGLDRFKESFPDQFLNVGIAEQNMVNIAAGMAKEGFHVFATTFANFAAMRSYEQIRLSLGYMKFPVKIVALGSGFAMGMFGNTHYGIEDVSLMRSIPNLTVISPADGVGLVKAIEASMRYPMPVYLRLVGSMNLPMVYREDIDFQIGKAIPLREGTDVTLIAAGEMVYESLKAAEMLEHSGVSAGVVDMHTIKPLDTKMMGDLAGKGGLLVTVEEHSVIGGLGGSIAEFLAGLEQAPRLVRIGIPDEFGRAGEYQYLLEKYGLTGNGIAARVSKELKGEKG